MKKLKQIKLLGLLGILVVLICSVPIIAQAGKRDKVTISVTENAEVGEKVRVKATVSSSVTRVTWSLSLDGKNVKINFNKTGGTFVPKKAGTYKLTCTATGRNFSKKYTKYIVVSEEEETTIVEEVTTVEETTNVEETTTAEETTTEKETTTVEETTTEKETTTVEEATTVEESTTKGEVETSDNAKMSITLNAPEFVLVNEEFDVSIVAVNCAHIEWYINGEYVASLENKINPSGTLKFDETGVYGVTVIGYTEDWSQNVWSNVAISVCDDLSQSKGNAQEHDRAMYSWNHDYIYLINESMLQKVMELTNCNILYQEIGPDASTKDVSAFLQRRGENGQTVYYLCGNASWAIEKDAASMLKEVERAIAYNEAAGEHKFVGIQFDVEPYCLEDFDEHAEEYMAQYVKNSKLAYEAAHEAGLLVEICIPYWWDTPYEFDVMLEDLIANACDSVAVMNYYKKNSEAFNITREVALCKKYDKRIINITETIPPGLHDLTEDNTYYHDGIDAIEEMWNKLDGYFQYDKMGYAFHWLDVIIELLELN